jgi:hypothetical protein
MHTLHLTHVAPGSELARVRAVRNAMRRLRGDDADSIGAADADRTIAKTRADGACLLGESDDLHLLVAVQEALDEEGCFALIDYRDTDEGLDPTPEEVFAEQQAEEQPSADGPAVLDATEAERPHFSTEAYETSMALLIAKDGNPLNAAITAYLLGRTTGDGDLYAETINALIHNCPWIGPMLAAWAMEQFGVDLTT